ncbi:heme exporter protein CcmD [Steroidobacter denitrificans]|uniref:Heme exporter protein D n=1 Tax=Steroidobacter denitrificans TaxID=465721 RepID=A0A127F9D7_STEDE|nr:heme exporter protein CcmD [Steroidobacter denitrificans]AMN47036.1 heme exporter protein CcmD [Steroidobacter denitrificans]
MYLQDFFYMSGYATYVWSCYGLTALVLGWNLWSARAQLQKQFRQAQRRLLAQQSASPGGTQVVEGPS